MASVENKPSKALEQMEESQYVESECNESAYGSEDGSTIELNNSVKETQEKVGKCTQNLEYWEKSNGILRNLFTALKAENVLLKEQSHTLENLNVELEKDNEVFKGHFVALNNAKKAWQDLSISRKEDNDALNDYIVALKEKK